MLHPINPQGSLYKILNKVPFILQIIIGMILGIILAVIIPHDPLVLPSLGTLFVSALKAIAPLLVFVLVSASIARQDKGSKTNMKPIICIYFASMVLSS